MQAIRWLLFLAVAAAGYPLLSTFPFAGSRWWLGFLVRLAWTLSLMQVLHWAWHKRTN